MFYRIKIKLPKNKIKQYAEPLPKSVSELSDNDFMSIVQKYLDHRALANEIVNNKLKYNGQPISWYPSNYQKELLTNFYFGNTIRLANEQEIPGNQFASVIDGSNIIHYFKNATQRNSIVKAYETLEINNNRFVLKMDGKNIEYIENYNQQYISRECTPEIFREILRQIYQNRSQPLSRSEYEITYKSSYVTPDGTLYKIPQKIDSQEIYNNVFKEVSQEFFPKIEIVEFTPESFKAFLSKFSRATKDEFEYQRKKCPYYFATKTQATYYFSYSDVNYKVYEYNRFIKKSSQEILVIWDDATKNRESTNSIADESLREIKADETLQWPEGIIFDTQYNSSDFKSFANAYLQKYNNDQIQTLIDAIMLENDENVRIEQENETYYFNLSTDFFLMNSDIQKQHEDNIKSKKEYEFKLFKKDNVWLCCVNKVSRNLHIPETIRLFHGRSDPNQYSLDAVLLTNGKLSHIIEYDGSYHFGLRDKADLEGDKEVSTNSFLNRMLADQLKSAYARSLNIPIIRVPDYNKYQKDQRWKDAFKLFILEKLNIIQPTSQNVNIDNFQRAAYTIRKIIK